MCPAMVNRKTPMLLHDSTRPHVAQPALEKLNELKIKTVPHPPYSPDLSSTDYHFFSDIGSFLVWKIIEEQSQSKPDVPGVPRTSDFYQTGILKLVSRWEKFIQSEENYFD